ncbi:hypothetical protein [Thermus sp.]|uniref:hypothetical protein n=1 Tax=Thermus sp. TaxID=275 RepID=UPI0025FED1CE|nr:hypothetical protein [Thermus sp.]MCS6867193.1 hypothetical protein [Thermus sp.]MDW8358498.1 hypothetical protein [Thermus sp.]
MKRVFFVPLLGLALAQVNLGGSILSGISPADRDLAQKTLIGSLEKLRAFYDRQVSGGELWFFVPVVSPWTLTLAQEWTSRRGGAVRYVVPEGTAASYCPTSYRNDTRFRVMPRGSLSKDQSIAVIWPPRNASQKGAVMAGRHLVDRPDWQEGDYVNITTPLTPTTSGLPEAQATVWGYYSQDNLQARVEFRETALGGVGYVGYRRYEGAWDGSDTFELGAGAERITLPVSSLPSSWVQVGPARDGAGRDRGYAQVLRQVNQQWQLDPGQTQNLTYTYELWFGRNPLGVSFQADVGMGSETFYLSGCTGSAPVRCNAVDAGGRVRGQATAQQVGVFAFIQWWEYRLTLYRWRVVEQVRWDVHWYLSGWQMVWRPARDNDRPVEPGGFVVAEGRRYQVPGLEGYLMPTGKEIEAAEGDPYITYITRQLLPDGNPYAPLGGQVPDKDTWYKPLSTWCQEKGL